jgi:hypothetical protein
MHVGLLVPECSIYDKVFDHYLPIDQLLFSEYLSKIRD